MSADGSAGGVTTPAATRPAPGFREAVAGDLAAMARAKGVRWPSVGGAVDVLTLPGTLAVLLFRVASAFYAAGLTPVSRLLNLLNVVLFGFECHGGAVVGPGLVVPHPVGVAFAGDVVIGRDVTMLRQVAIGGSGNPKRPGHPVIGDRVWLLDSCRVFGPITVGDDAIIGASAIVSDDVPPEVMVMGPRKSTDVRSLAELGLGPYEEGAGAERRPEGHRRSGSAPAEAAAPAGTANGNGRG